MIVFDEAHKKILHPSRLPLLKKYLNKHVEAWSAFITWASGFVIPEREVALIYGYTKTERSLHIAVRPEPKSKRSPRASFSVTVDRSRGVYATIDLPPGWDGECLGGPHLDCMTDLLSRYVFVNYLTKDGIVGQILRAAKDIFMPAKNNSWIRVIKDRETDESDQIPRVGSPPFSQSVRGFIV